MKVMKFGGSSVANPQCLKEVAGIVLREASKERIVVVVSAFQGITNQLLDCARLAEAGDESYLELYDQIGKRHRATIDELHGKRTADAFRKQIDQLLSELHDALHGIRLLRHSAPRVLDLVASFVERLTALTLASLINRSQKSAYVNALDL